MLKMLPSYIKFAALVSISFLVAIIYPNDKSFKSILIDYINNTSAGSQSEIKNANEMIDSSSDQTKRETGREKYALFSNLYFHPIGYQKGDWDKYIIIPGYAMKGDEYKSLMIYDSDDLKVQTYGSMTLNLKYGKSYFTEKKYRQFDEDKPVSKVVHNGFYPEQVMLLHMEGTVGDRMTVFIDHDSRREDNIYKMQYKAVKDDEIIREINAGQIDIKFDRSKYAVYDNNSAKGMGLDVTLKKDNFKIKTFGSVTRGETEVELFKGNSTSGSFKLSDYQYTKRKYYQIEPFKRYDNLSSIPSGSAAYGTLSIFTSSYPSGNYQVYPVNIDPAGFEIYMDDQIAQNNYNAVKLSIDNGYYTKLAMGRDYSINYATGEVTFFVNIAESARIFAVYNLKSGTSSDPGVLSPGDSKHPGSAFIGKYFVFIKYGYSMDEDSDKNLTLGPSEDRNGDGKLNLDIYEIRSVYNVGEKQLQQNNFQILFYRENKLLTTGDLKILGKYTMDYTNGLIKFTFREPFKELLKSNYSSTVSQNVYTERQVSNIYTDSHFSMKVDYFRDARSFKLKHFNIIPNSVNVKVNRRDIPEHLYTVDYTSGLFLFIDQNNPLIGPETDIEIRYEYLPFGTSSQSFVGGIRSDYELNRNLNIGGTLLYNRSASARVIPNIGDTPSQTLLYEGDASLHLDGKRLADLTNIFTGTRRDSIPVEIKAYGEYAKSIKKVNTFGKALIDNMESPDEIINVSLSEKDWILSSMPAGLTQNDRGILNYYFYREPSHPGALKGRQFNAIKVDYSVKPGPFNIAAGHVEGSIQKEESQKSLVLDFDFSTGSGLSIATRKLSDKAVDFSGLQYIEIWYQYEGTATVSMSIDMGRINEDSDGDGILDTEDVNYNGFLDTDPNAGYSEDRGYSFNGNIPTRAGSGPGLNSITMGDGVLNSEDLNGNGMLDTIENIYSLQTISLIGNDSRWKMKRIFIDQSSLSKSDVDILKQVEAVRLNLLNSSGSKGRVFIDSIKFVSLRFRNPEMNGFPAGPSNLSISIVNSISDSEYRGESFMFLQKELYTSLYGNKTDKELSKASESALQMDYSITSGNYVSVTRKFLKPIDLRFYKTMNLWYNMRSRSGNEKIGIVLGSSDSDFIVYQISADFLKIWREIKLKLNRGSHGDHEIVTLAGNIDYKRISFIKIFIQGDTGNSGRVWINDIYVSEPEDLKDKAHWYEGEIKIKKPLYTTDSGTPILSDINIKYIQKGHGSQFSTVGKTFTDVSENYKELFSSMKIIPNWETQIDYINEASVTDSLNEEVKQDKRGSTNMNTFQFISDYTSLNSPLPSVKIAYKHNNYKNRSDQNVSSYSINKETEKVIHSPVVTIREELNDFLMGKLLTNLYLDMLFKNEKITRDSSELGRSGLSAIAPVSENEKRQKSDANLSINYSNNIFFIRPEFGMGTEEIVRLKGRTELNDTEVLSNVHGDYHIPFLYNNSLKYTARNKKIQASAGIKEDYILSPKYKLELSYIENRFKDYDDNEKSFADNFTRSKDASSFVLSEINLPVSISSSRELRVFKNFNISFMRSLYLYETDIPYEGEKTDPFEEEFGIKHSLFRHVDTGTNYFRYFPGYFFMGRNNYSNGRDFAYKNSNDQLTYPSGNTAANYNNQMRLIDNITMNWNYDFKIFTVDTGLGINQVAERQNIKGIPQQAVTRSINTKFNLDMMKIFYFGFFRPNRIDLPHHSANIDLGYNFSNNLLITSNMEENVHSPWVGFTFKWDRSHVGIISGIDYRIKKARTFISSDDTKRSGKDDIYYFNMPENASISEQDYGYKFTVLYETNVNWLYDLFSQMYKLISHPIFSIEYSMILNRYDYSKTVSPEPYDQFLVRSKIMLDLHRNIQGGINSVWVLERFRNRETSGISKEIVSYEIGFNFSLIF